MNTDDVIADLVDALRFASPQTLVAIYNRDDLQTAHESIRHDEHNTCECGAADCVDLFVGSEDGTDDPCDTSDDGSGHVGPVILCHGGVMCDGCGFSLAVTDPKADEYVLHFGELPIIDHDRLHALTCATALGTDPCDCDATPIVGSEDEDEDDEDALNRSDGCCGDPSHIHNTADADA